MGLLNQLVERQTHQVPSAELCVVYQSALLRVERHILADCTATIASIQHYLSEFVTILPGVHTVLHEIMNLSNRTDAAVMGVLFDRAQCGAPSLEAVLERLLWNCNQVLYRHLSAWCAINIHFDLTRSYSCKTCWTETKSLDTVAEQHYATTALRSDTSSVHGAGYFMVFC